MPALGWLLLSPPAGAMADDSVGAGIYQHCKTCHGTAGEGGSNGKYPRIAGLSQDYLQRQLNHFKLRKRINKPMVPIFKNWRFDQDAMAEVSAYIAAMPIPDIAGFEPGAERLTDFDSREEFDGLGEELFVDNCAQCHGEDAQGRLDKEAPPLVNQYPAYLMKQIADFVAGRREHEHAAKMFGEMYQEEIEAILTHVGQLAKSSSGGN